MNKLLLILILILAGNVTLIAQQTEYVCTPCGQSCDERIFHKPGFCPDCNMKLIPKSEITFENLSVEEFCNRIASNPSIILLDVRSKAEFTGERRNSYGYFKNAININIDGLEKDLVKLEDFKDREILIYCSHSIRSPRAALILSRNNFKNLKNLKGGVSTITPSENACLQKHFVTYR